MMVLATVVALALLQQPAGTQAFDHVKHKALFPSCTTCHAGAARADASLWPAAASCAACHDGTMEKALSWTPPAAARRSNLRFGHRAPPKNPGAQGAAAG